MRVTLLAVVLLLFASDISVQGKLSRWWKRRTSIATYNTALVSFYPELESRAEVLADKLKNSKVDIWCLQEVWFADVQRKLYDEVKDKYKYALSAINLTDDVSDSGELACTSTAVMNIETCATQSNCAVLYNSTEAVASCVVQNCSSIISGLTDTCRGCAIHSMGNGIETVKACSTTENASRYDTTYGLMLLSKKELKDTNYGGINNKSQFRGYLKATVDSVGELFCVHLSSSASPVYVGPPVTSPFLYSTYAEQQYDEISVLMKLMEGAVEPIILGDFNHGPIVPGGISDILPFHYGLMSASGLISPYVHACGLCTWCGGGLNYAATVTVPYDYVLDHIYISSMSYSRVLKVERLFDDVTVNTSTSPSVELPLSDHYGIMVQLQDYRLNCNWIQFLRYDCKTEEESESMKYRALTSLDDSKKDLCVG